jgi:diacylglycerol kinase (ATP)
VNPIHLLVNPLAGRGRAIAQLRTVADGLRANGREVVELRTEYAGHARTLVEVVPAGGTVVALGGDGTVHELLPACLARDLQLGVVPAGSGDDFAFALGIGRTDPAAAVATVLAGRERRVDVGLVNGEPFVNAFGTGFDADVARRVLAAPRQFRGLGRYLYGILGAMRAFHLAEARLELDDGAGRRLAFAGRSLLVAVQNGPRGGGSFLFAPGAALDDGSFDVLVAGDFGRLGTLGILPRVMRGTHEGHPRVWRFAARALTLTWSRPMAAHAEGESLPAETRYEVSLRPRALRVLAPSP